MCPFQRHTWILTAMTTEISSLSSSRITTSFFSVRLHNLQTEREVHRMFSWAPLVCLKWPNTRVLHKKKKRQMVRLIQVNSLHPAKHVPYAKKHSFSQSTGLKTDCVIIPSTRSQFTTAVNLMFFYQTDNHTWAGRGRRFIWTAQHIIRELVTDLCLWMGKKGNCICLNCTQHPSRVAFR